MFINASLAVILVMTRFLLNVFSILNAIDFFPNFRLYIFYLQNNAIFKNVFFFVFIYFLFFNVFFLIEG